MVVRKNVGGREVNYQVCREGNDGEDCSEKGAIATFDFKIDRNSSHELAVNSEGFTIKESLFLPYSWQVSEPADIVETWTRIDVLGGNDLIPSQAPPFFVYRFASDQ